MKKALKNERGLTLVELLAVIVILGIIAAIAVPSIGHLINRTNDKAKVAEAVQIIDAAKLYVADHGVPQANTSETLNKTKLDPYLDNVKDTSFAVIVTADSNGKLSYSLSGHDAIKIAHGNKESDFTKWLSENN